MKRYTPSLYLFRIKSLKNQRRVLYTRKCEFFWTLWGMEIFSKNGEFEKLEVKTTLLGLERDICFQPNNS